MDRLPTPEELGEMLKAGKISRDEAVEIMDQRARGEALGLFPGFEGRADASPREGKDQPEERNDLIVEEFHGPGVGRMRGSSREIWEYETESVGPSRNLVFTFVTIVGVLAGVVALLIYMFWRLTR